MNKTCPVLAILLAAQCLPFSGARAASGAAGQDLLNIFDGGYPRIDASSLISAHIFPAPRVPAPVPANARQKMLYEILAEYKEGGNKGVLPTMQEIELMIRRDYGRPPSNEQRDKIYQALGVLQNTKFGKDICAAAAYECTPESIKKAGIVILVKESAGMDGAASAEVPPPVHYAGQIYIGVSSAFIDGPSASPSQLAITLTHEMSHIEDLAQNHLGTLSKAMYATEEKAVMKALSVYDEISRKSPDCYSDIYEVLVDVWKWKNEDGPYPRHRVLTINIDGEPRVMTTRDLIQTYMKPTFSFMEAMKNFVRAVYRKEYGNPSVNPELVKKLKQETSKASDSYKQWRVNPSGTVQEPAVQTPPTQNPSTQQPATQPPSAQTPITQPPAIQTPATQTPLTPSTGNSGNNNNNGNNDNDHHGGEGHHSGGGGGQSGTGTNNGTGNGNIPYNPHFQPWQ